MTQEETKENFNSKETASYLPENSLNSEKTATDSSEQADHQEIDNLPIESIGSYARLEELLTDDESENTINHKSRS